MHMHVIGRHTKRPPGKLNGKNARMGEEDARTIECTKAKRYQIVILNICAYTPLES